MHSRGLSLGKFGNSWVAVGGTRNRPHPTINLGCVGVWSWWLMDPRQSGGFIWGTRYTAMPALAEYESSAITRKQAAAKLNVSPGTFDACKKIVHVSPEMFRNSTVQLGKTQQRTVTERHKMLHVFVTSFFAPILACFDA